MGRIKDTTIVVDIPQSVASNKIRLSITINTGIMMKP
jgi:hypothetical protein